jgi:hypothetical protein
VFTANGSYASPAAFMHGLRFALLAAAVTTLATVIPAAIGGARSEAGH